MCVPHRVMDFFRSVHRQANQEMIVFEKLAPFFCNCITIGLKRILYLYMIPVVLVLKFNCFFEETNSAQGWLTALISVAYHALCPQHRFPYYVFQRLLTHVPERFLCTFLCFITVETIVAGHVAHAGRWFH